jgi:integrase
MATIINGKERGRPGRWLVDYRDGSGTRRWITCRTRQLAEVELAKVLREWGQPRGGSADANILVKPYYEKWLGDLAATGRKQRSVDCYKSLFNRHVLPAFGKMQLRKVGRGAIKDFLVQRLKEGFARDSVRSMLSAMRSLCSAAVEDGVIAVNPAAKLGRQLRLTLPTQQRQDEIKIKAMTQPQLTTFLSAAKRVPLLYGSLLWTLALTGMRFGEGLGLQWDDVDIEKGEIRVQRTVSHGVIGTPKSGHSRRVKIGQALAKMLLRLRMHRAEQARRHEWSEMPAWVFPTSTGGPPEPNQLRRHFRICLTVAGLPSHFTPHCLRHSFASLLLAKGETPQWVKRQLGHSSIQLTVDTYGHWLPEEPTQGGVDLIEDLAGVGSSQVAKRPERARKRGESVIFDARFAQCRARYSPPVT